MKHKVPADELEGLEQGPGVDVVPLASAAVMENVRDVAGRVGGHVIKSPYRSTGFVPGQVEDLDVPVGVPMDRELGFPVHSIRIDNPTKQWLWISAINAFVPPGQLGAVFQCPRATTFAQVKWRAPGGVAQPAAAGGGTEASFLFCEAYLQPTPGILVTIYPLPAIA